LFLKKHKNRKTTKRASVVSVHAHMRAHIKVSLAISYDLVLV